jgi:hypothetical protein
MAELTLKSIEGRLLAMLHNKLEAPALRSLLETQYREIVNTHGWSFAKVESEFSTAAELSGGTITLTNGAKTITGASTAFTSEYDDGILRVDSTYYRCNTFTTTTAGTTKHNYGGTTGGSKTYALNKSHYELDASVWYMTSLTGGQRDLYERSLREIDDIDPSRQSSGEPLFYAYTGMGSNGGRIIELWPVPTTAEHFNYTGMKHLSFALTANTTTIQDMVVTALIKGTAAQAALSISLAVPMEEAQRWMMAHQAWARDYQATIGEIQFRDLNALGSRDVQQSGREGGALSSDFMASHDPWADL